MGGCSLLRAICQLSWENSFLCMRYHLHNCTEASESYLLNARTFPFCQSSQPMMAWETNRHERKVTRLMRPRILVVIANTCPPTHNPHWAVDWYDDSWVSSSAGTWWFFNWSDWAQRLQGAKGPEGKSWWVIHKVRWRSAPTNMLVGKKKAEISAQIQDEPIRYWQLPRKEHPHSKTFIPCLFDSTRAKIMQ